MPGRGIGPGPGLVVGPRRPLGGPGTAALRAMGNIDTTTNVDVAAGGGGAPSTATAQQEQTGGGAAPSNPIAPDVAGLGKISNSEGAVPPPQAQAQASSATQQQQVQTRKRIIRVPQRACNGGFDFKFQDDPYNLKLYNIMSSNEYQIAIQRLNNKLKPSRSKKFDAALLVTGPLMLPLIPWAIRHSQQTKRRKRLLREGIDEFNDQNPSLYMRYNKEVGGGVSFLSIETRQQSSDVAAPSTGATATSQQQQQPQPHQLLVAGLEDSMLV